MKQRRAGLPAQVESHPLRQLLQSAEMPGGVSRLMHHSASIGDWDSAQAWALRALEVRGTSPALPYLHPLPPSLPNSLSFPLSFSLFLSLALHLARPLSPSRSVSHSFFLFRLEAGRTRRAPGSAARR